MADTGQVKPAFASAGRLARETKPREDSLVFWIERLSPRRRSASVRQSRTQTNSRLGLRRRLGTKRRRRNTTDRPSSHAAELPVWFAARRTSPMSSSALCHAWPVQLRAYYHSVMAAVRAERGSAATGGHPGAAYSSVGGPGPGWQGVVSKARFQHEPCHDGERRRAQRLPSHVGAKLEKILCYSGSEIVRENLNPTAVGQARG
jgi:hypothetical protein